MHLFFSDFTNNVHRHYFMMVKTYIKKILLTLILLVFLFKTTTEFRGSYEIEILYVAQSIHPRKIVTRAVLLETAVILQERANTLGISEPEVIIEGNNILHVKLADVSNGEQVKALLNQPDSLPVKLTEKYLKTVKMVSDQPDFYKMLRASTAVLIIILLFMELIIECRS